MVRADGAPGRGTTVAVRGGRPLGGRVRISGFKHSLVSVLAAAVAVGGDVRLENVPDIEDTRVLCAILSRCGGRVSHDPSQATLDLRLDGVHGGEIPPELSDRIHGSIYLVPALLARTGRAAAAGFGGCRIGDSGDAGRRPVHHVVEVLARFGADAAVRDEGLTATAHRLVGTTVDLRDFMSDRELMTGPLYSGATKTALIAAAAAHGTSAIRYPYPKPDVTELVAALRAAGIRVDGADGSAQYVVHGQGPHRADFTRRLPADGLEVLTFLTCSVHLRSRLLLTGVTPDDLRGIAAEIDFLRAMGIEPTWTEHGDLYAQRPDGPVRAHDAVVASRGIFSDAQPFLSLLLTGADAPATVRDTVWPDRFAYASELTALGADIAATDSGSATIRPRTPSRGGLTVHATELRGAATLLLAALGIDGTTVIEGVDHLDRGYDDLIGKLIALGGDIAAVDATADAA